MTSSKHAPALDVVRLAESLMRIDSTSGSETKAIDYLYTLLSERGWQTQRILVNGTRSNVYAASSVDPQVTLSSHIDTVPPYIPPRLDAERLWGRGACDAKGIVAAMVCAAERLRLAGVGCALLIVVGEETNQDGAHAANAAPGIPRSSKVLINGEPTESRLAVGTKGALWIRVSVKGIAAHSAYPAFGRSAITELVRILKELDSLQLPVDPLLGSTTVNIGTIAGGLADNVVAPSATASLLVRVVVPLPETMEAIKKWVKGRAEVELIRHVPLCHLAILSGYSTSVVAFGTDIPNLRSFGEPYLFGPGSIHVAHTDRENIRLDELRASVDVYEKLARDALFLKPRAAVSD